MFEWTPVYWVYAMAALCGILLAEAAFLLVARRHEARDDINRRVRLQQKAARQSDVLVQLRKERGIASAGRTRDWLGRLKALRVRSGIRMSLPRLVLACAAAASALGGLAALRFGSPYPLAVAPVIGACVLPYLVLSHLTKRRLKHFGTQLPEALDLIVRGLKAGHPVPVALAMVGREMPDPIGSEFGMIADELTYGSDIVSALQALNDRVGHEDLPLFVTAVSIQSSTGGNLREILDGLADTIRGRVKLRRKIRAISTEGRMSAYILTAVPGLLAGAVLLISPGYYSGVMDETLTYVLFGVAAGLLAIGNFAMFRMANFRF
jgi:tight adherence protein B